jgi:hypothetical protein
MAQTGISTEESSERTSSLKPTEGLKTECPDPVLPAPTPSESGPSGAKLAERSSERKQPARASKRDIVFVRKTRHNVRISTILSLDACSLPPFSRATARAMKSKVHQIQDAPQLAPQ